LTNEKEGNKLLDWRSERKQAGCQPIVDRQTGGEGLPEGRGDLVLKFQLFPDIIQNFITQHLS
jgi:hypothetical protein